MFSKKRKKQEEEYRKLRKRFLTQNRNCIAIRIDTKIRCLNPATQVHHRKGRGKYLLSIATWMPVCHHCHEMIHKCPSWSREHDYMINRLSKKPILPLTPK